MTWTRFLHCWSNNFILNFATYMLINLQYFNVYCYIKNFGSIVIHKYLVNTYWYLRDMSMVICGTWTMHCTFMHIRTMHGSSPTLVKRFTSQNFTPFMSAYNFLWLYHQFMYPKAQKANISCSYPGPLFTKRQGSYHQIPWSPDAARLAVIINGSLWNLPCLSAVLLPRCMSNVRAIEKV